MKRVITYGTFDLLHYGHINLLRRARQMGDYLIVALSTDEFNWREKQKKCYFSYEKRKQLLEAIRYVDLVIPEESWAQKRKDVKEYHVDTFIYHGHLKFPAVRLKRNFTLKRIYESERIDRDYIPVNSFKEPNRYPISSHLLRSSSRISAFVEDVL